jgi:hypothetical protein
MIAHCNLDDSDYRAFRRHVIFRYRKIHWLYGGLLIVILLLTWFGGQPEETIADKVFLLIGGVIIFGGFGLAFYLILRLISRFTGTHFRGTVGEHVFEISEDGLRIITHEDYGRAEGSCDYRCDGVRSRDLDAMPFGAAVSWEID